MQAALVPSWGERRSIHEVKKNQSCIFFVQMFPGLNSPVTEVLGRGSCSIRSMRVLMNEYV